MNWYCSGCKTQHDHNVYRHTILTGSDTQEVLRTYSCGTSTDMPVKCLACKNQVIAAHIMKAMTFGVEETHVCCSIACVKIIKRQYKKTHITHKCCLYCKQFSKELKMCSGCKLALYCNAECQRADWSRHKARCSHN